MNFTDKQINNFFNKIKIVGDCWEWDASKNNHGYGLVVINYKIQTAHRFSYRLFKGEISDGLLVCHTCDNPSCVNPDHLFEGSMSDNIIDCVKKGRHKHPVQSKTTVHPTKSLYYDGCRCELCKNFMRNIWRENKRRKIIQTAS